MPVSKFTYGWNILITGIVLPLFLILTILASVSMSNWIYLMGICIALLFAMIKISTKCITYDLRIKTALILDKEKLQYLVENIVIPWNDVTSIDYVRNNGWGQIMYIFVRAKSSTIKIATSEIAGDSKYIFDCVAYYYEQAKTK